MVLSPLLRGWVYFPKGVVLSPLLVIWGVSSSFWGGFIRHFWCFDPPICRGGVGLAHLNVNQETHPEDRQTHSALFRLLWFRLFCFFLLFCALPAPPPPCLGTALCKNRPWFHGRILAQLFLPVGIGFSIVPVDVGRPFRCAGHHGGIKPPWGGSITPKGVVLTRGGGFIPHKGWFYPPKGVVLSLKRGGSIPPKSGHETTRGGFKGGFIPHLGVVLCPGPGRSVATTKDPLDGGERASGLEQVANNAENMPPTM